MSEPWQDTGNDTVCVSISAEQPGQLLLLTEAGHFRTRHEGYSARRKGMIDHCFQHVAETLESTPCATPSIWPSSAAITTKKFAVLLEQWSTRHLRNGVFHQTPFEYTHQSDPPGKMPSYMCRFALNIAQKRSVTGLWSQWGALSQTSYLNWEKGKEGKS